MFLSLLALSTPVPYNCNHGFHSITIFFDRLDFRGLLSARVFKLKNNDKTIIFQVMLATLSIGVHFSLDT